MSTTEYTRPYDYAAALLALCDDALAETTEGRIARTYVSPGLPAIDCATLAVAAVSLNEGLTAPGAPALASAHRYARARVNLLGFAIVVARDCVPVSGPRGSAPDPAALSAAAAIVDQDVWVIWERIMQAMNAGDLFGGRCTELFMDNAAALATTGQTAGWQISIRTALGGLSA